MSDAMNAAEYPMQSQRKDCVNGTCICEVVSALWGSEKVVSGLWKLKTVVLLETVVETRVSPAHVPRDST